MGCFEAKYVTIVNLKRPNVSECAAVWSCTSNSSEMATRLLLHEKHVNLEGSNIFQCNSLVEMCQKTSFIRLLLIVLNDLPKNKKM